MSKNLKIYLTALIAVLFITVTAQNTIYVKQDGSGDYTTITTAVGQASAGDIIYVEAGIYDETVTITKSLELRGATWDVSKENFTVPANYTYADQTVIQLSNPAAGWELVVNSGVNNVTVKGFVFQVLNAVGQTGFAVRYVGNNNNMVFENNIVGPILNLGDAPYSYTGNANGQGRMGLSLYNSGGIGVTNSSIKYNTICDTKGNGINVFIYGTNDGGVFNPETMTYATMAADQSDFTGCYFEHNNIYGSRRSGFEICGGVKGLRIGYNKIYNQGPNLPVGDINYDHLKFGNGIAIIRIGSMYYSQNSKAGAYDFEIYNNEIYNNSKCGIYICPLAKNIRIYNNNIHDNKWAAVYVDLTDQFYVNWPDPYTGFVPVGDNGMLTCTNQTETIELENNIIVDNGSEIGGLDLVVVGTPTNGFVMKAESNYFGGNAGDVSAYVDILPYWLDEPMTQLSEEGGYQGGDGNWYDNFGDAIDNTAEGGTIKVGLDILVEQMVVNKNITIDGTINVHPGASLTVLPGATLTVNGNLNILANNKYGMGSIIEYGNIVLAGGKAGVMTAQLALTGGAGPVYHYVSPVIAAASKNLFTGTPSFYAYTESLVTGNNYAIGWNAAPSTLVAGQGYAIHYTDNKTITYTGAYNNGTLDVSPLTFTTNTCIPAHKGWNLIGNPYPSSINVDNITTWTSVNAAVYYYKASAQNYVYYVRKSGASSNGGTNIILPGQGFFVQTRSGAAPAIQFTDAIRTHEVNTEFYKKDNSNNNSLSLILSNGSFSDEAVVAFNTGATANFDGDFDAFKLFSPVANIYTLSVDGELAINTMAEYKSVPVVVKAEVPGKYNLTFNGLNSFNKNVSIYLEDTKTGAMYDLRSTATVELNVESTSGFILHFNNTANGIAGKTVKNSNIYSVDNYIYINNTADNAKVEVYNLLGELVTAQNLTSSLNKISIDGTGYYLVKVSTDSNTTTQKVFIK